MKRAARAKVFLGLVMLALVSLSVVYLMDNPGMKRAAAPAKKTVRTDQAEVLIDGFRLSKKDDEKGNWELVAKKAVMRKDTGKGRLDDLEAVFYEKDGTVVKLKADHGTFDSNAKAATVVKKDKDVKVTTSNGYTMTSKELSWDGLKKELKTDEKVNIQGKDIKIEGKGLKAKTDLQEVWISDGVKTTFTQSR